jgi:misacylated tRNA(Ala) deacylase
MGRMTDRLYLVDDTMFEATATVVSASPAGVVLDRSPFYPRAGGQPGDAGTLAWSGGAMPVVEARKGEGETIMHVPADGAPLPPVGASVTATIDGERRMKHARMHTALHLLCALLPGVAVTGGQIGADRSRLDVDLAVAPDKETLEQGFAALVAAAHPVTTAWVDESVLDTNPELVRTLSVQPPRGTGRLRLVRIGAVEPPIDLQPCGGTHVAHTGLVGRVRVLKIENKGRQNRRISIALEE